MAVEQRTKPTFFEGLDDVIRSRPAPDVHHALMAASGALLALAGMVVAGDSRSDGRTVPVVVCLVLVGLGYGAVLSGARVLRPAGVAVLAVGLGALPAFVIIDEDTTSVTGPLALMTILWALAYIVPATRGRPFLLGLALAGAWATLFDAVGDDFATNPDGSFQSDANSAFYISLFIGAGYLLASWALDRRSLPGLATPFVAVGDIAVVVGTGGVAADLGDTGGSVLVIASGAALGVVGHAGGRRLTTWLGAATVASGAVGLVGAIVGDDAEPLTAAALLAVAALVVAAAVFAAERLESGAAPRSTGSPDVAGGAGSTSGGGPAGGWYPDPTGRFPARWWDGSRWTEHVTTADGERRTDPPVPR